jgi:glucosamine-phosphate N-acetyltransferase
MKTLRKIESTDFCKGYLDLLEELTTVDKHLISHIDFDLFVQLLNVNHLVYVIEHNDVIIASGTLLIEHKLIHGCGKVGHIEDIVIHSSYKGQQLGKLIVDSLVAYAKEHKCYKVILDCSDDLIGFYEKCNFERKGSEMATYFN